MADSSIGALPQAPQLDDDSLLVAEQQGQAMKVTGAQFKEFGRQAVIGQVQSYVDAAQARSIWILACHGGRRGNPAPPERRAPEAPRDRLETA